MSATEPIERLAYLVSEIAESTGLSDQTIYREIESGRLEARRIRGRIVVTRPALDRWLAHPRNDA